MARPAKALQLAASLWPLAGFAAQVFQAANRAAMETNVLRCRMFAPVLCGTVQRGEKTVKRQGQASRHLVTTAVRWEAASAYSSAPASRRSGASHPPAQRRST